ncbi:fimbrial biogenesis chaperone [Citrobacter werkmanii]|uniref:fimbrial biogenesis chaperone n=1 Tax=Citrobacter werkmanii TaxID=67827 RepID=UPI00265507F9|nr:fimbria/pilus periplasmic chaperone [Citrobacter werkmanii]MDN8559083.1 fimbria/pilus periplasmic chaperone [Citrobacter werkmanii]
MKKLRVLLSLLGVALAISVCGAQAGGIALGGTRIIYPADATQTSLSVRNTSQKDVFLIQSWVSDAKGQKSHDFIVTPPLFVMNPGKENTLRLELTGKPAWPADRESLYYFNSKAIPSTPAVVGSHNSLQIATETIIKMFIRPAGLSLPVADAAAKLSCHTSGTNITINNPSPYYISMVNLLADSEKLPSAMVAPKSSLVVHSRVPAGKLSFQTINDYGAVSSRHLCQNG